MGFMGFLRVSPVGFMGSIWDLWDETNIFALKTNGWKISFRLPFWGPVLCLFLGRAHLTCNLLTKQHGTCIFCLGGLLGIRGVILQLSPTRIHIHLYMTVWVGHKPMNFSVCWGTRWELKSSSCIPHQIRSEVLCLCLGKPPGG